MNFLNTWLQEWRERILLHRGVAKKTEESGDDDDDYDSDFEDSSTDDDNEDLQNCLLVTGPVGVGRNCPLLLNVQDSKSSECISNWFELICAWRIMII